MKVCFDTCSVVDILGRSDWFFPAYCAYDTAVYLGFEPCLSVSSTTDVVYLLHARGFLSRKESRDATEEATELFELFENTPADSRRAFQSKMDDYEDALIAFSAESAGAEILITRNKKDFKHSPITVLTPEEFLRDFKPDDLVYEEISFS